MKDPSPSAVVVSSSTIEVIPGVVVSLFEGMVVLSASIVVEATVVSTLGHCPQVLSQCFIICGLSHLPFFDMQNSSPFASTH